MSAERLKLIENKAPPLMDMFCGSPLIERIDGNQVLRSSCGCSTSSSVHLHLLLHPGNAAGHVKLKTTLGPTKQHGPPSRLRPAPRSPLHPLSSTRPRCRLYPALLPSKLRHLVCLSSSPVRPTLTGRSSHHRRPLAQLGQNHCESHRSHRGIRCLSNGRFHVCRDGVAEDDVDCLLESQSRVPRTKAV